MMRHSRSSRTCLGLSWLLATSTLAGPVPPPASAPAEPAREASTAGERSESTALRVYDDVVALCIGIDAYESDGIRPLRFAEKDATDVARLLSERYGYRTITLLGDQATKANIEKTINQNKRPGRRGAFILFFSGHGDTCKSGEFTESGYLLPYDARIDQSTVNDVGAYDETAISTQVLLAQLYNAEALHVLVLLDCCFSGFASKQDMPPMKSVEAEGPCYYVTRRVLTAGLANQKAYEHAPLKNGFFTHVLLKTLGRRPRTRVRDLWAAMSEVESLAMEYKKKQQFPASRDLVPTDGEFCFEAVGSGEQNDATDEAPDPEPDVVGGDDGRSIDEDDVREAFDAPPAATQPAGTPPASQPTTTEPARPATSGPATSAPATQPAEDPALEFARVKRQAQAGNPNAMAVLSQKYAKGDGTAKDDRAAYLWAQEAHNSKSPYGTLALAQRYQQGQGVGADNSKAQRLYSSVISQPVARDWMRSLARFQGSGYGGAGPPSGFNPSGGYKPHSNPGSAGGHGLPIPDAGEVINLVGRLRGGGGGGDHSAADRLDDLFDSFQKVRNLVEQSPVKWDDVGRALEKFKDRIDRVSSASFSGPDQSSVQAMCNELRGIVALAGNCLRDQTRRCMQKQVSAAQAVLDRYGVRAR